MYNWEVLVAADGAVATVDQVRSDLFDWNKKMSDSGISSFCFCFIYSSLKHKIWSFIRLQTEKVVKKLFVTKSVSDLVYSDSDSNLGLSKSEFLNQISEESENKIE
jgi:hypothetical protein